VFETNDIEHNLLPTTVLYTDACKTYHTTTVYKAVFLKMNQRFRNI